MVLLVNTFLPHSDCRIYIGYLCAQELILNWLHYVTVLEHWISHITCLLCYFRTDLSVYFVHLLKNFCLFLAVTLLSVIGVFQLQPRVFGTVFHLILDFLSHYLLLKRI